MRLLLLTCVMLVCLGFSIMIAELTGGSLVTCVAALAIVLPCSVAGQVAGEFPRGPQFALLRLMGTIFARTGLLLAFLLVARRWDLSRDGFIYYILAFYATGLLTDVVLTSLKTWQGDTVSQTSEPHTSTTPSSSELAAN